MNKSVAYIRTSSQVNVGEDKDSKKRQIECIENWCSTNNHAISKTFYDAGVSGSIPHLERKEFAQMIEYCCEKNIKTIVMESLDRFARDIIVQETAIRMLSDIGFKLVFVKNDGEVVNNPTSELIRGVLGLMNQYQKKEISIRLHSARKRKALVNKKKGITTLDGKGKCEGQKSYKEEDSDIVREVRRLYRRSPKTRKRNSMRKIVQILNESGFKNRYGSEIKLNTVRRILDQ